MKALRLALVALACAASPLFADSSAVSQPVPIKVVAPTGLEPGFINETVYLRFRLGCDGIPRDVAPASRMPTELSDRLVAAVSQWRFKPCQDSRGVAVEREVVMPLELADH